MAEIGIIEKVHAKHGNPKHEHDFKIEIILEGKLDSKPYVAGIDWNEVIPFVRSILSRIENKDLKDILIKEQKFKSSGCEALAIFLIKKIKEKYPVKFIKVWETENRYATIYTNEI